MICARCDLNITLLFGALSEFPHAALTTAASVSSRTQAVTLAARASKQVLLRLLKMQDCAQVQGPSCLLKIFFYILARKAMHGPRRLSSNVMERHPAMPRVLAAVESWCYFLELKA